MNTKKETSTCQPRVIRVPSCRFVGGHSGRLMRNVRYIDISVPLGPGTTVYPGDPPPRLSWPAWSHDRGDAGNLGYFEGSLHTGTHADAPWHFVRGGLRLDEVPLGHWLGPCVVAGGAHRGAVV